MKRKTAVLVGVLFTTPLLGYGAPESALSENGIDAVVTASVLTRTSSIVRKSVMPPRVLIQIFPTVVASTVSPNSGMSKTNAMLGTRGESVPTERNQYPAAWGRIGYLEWPDIVLTTCKSWRGNVNPTAPFGNEYGNRIKWVTVVRTTNGVPFAAHQLRFGIQSSFPGLRLTGNLATNSSNGTEIPYQFIMQGHNYGGDSIPNSADDIWYSSDSLPVSSSALVHELYYFGVTSAFSAASATDIIADRNTLTAPGFFVSCTYTLSTVSDADGGSATVTLDTAPRAVIRKIGGGYGLDVIGQPGFTYSIEYRYPSQWADVWFKLQTPGVFVANYRTFTDTFGNSVALFRLRQAAAP